MTESFEEISNKIKTEFEFNSNSADFVAFFKPFIIKVFLNIIFSEKTNRKTKIAIFNIFLTSPKVLKYLLELISDKELLIILNSVDINDLLVNNIDDNLKVLLKNRLNKEVGVFPKVKLLKQIPTKLQNIINDWKNLELNTNINQNIINRQPNEITREQINNGNNFETPKFETLNQNSQITDKTLKNNVQIDFQDILIGIEFSESTLELLKKATNIKDKILIIANKEKIDLFQLERLKSLLKEEHDIGALFVNVLLNKQVNKDIDILKYIINNARKFGNFELWSDANDQLNIAEEENRKKLEEEKNNSFVGRLNREREMYN